MAWLPYKQWRKHQDQELVEEALLFEEVAVERCPTMHDLRCRSCGHQGRAWVHPDIKEPKFRCKKCGARCF